MILHTLEDLMPKEHFLRDLDAAVDFSFIYDKVEDLYASSGRPSVDPVVLVKILLIGYLYGIPSERKLEQEIQVNIAYRWFLGMDFGEPVPNHSTISQLRRRKFSGTTIFRDIFDEIVRKCIEAGLVTGKLLLTDSTHILANARKDKRQIIEVPDTPTEYMQKLDKEAVEQGLLKEQPVYPEKMKEVTQSTTDPESGLLNRPGKPNEFCYLNHQTCDADSGIITDTFVTAGNVADCVPHVSRLEAQIDKFGFETEAVSADAAYANREAYQAMHKRGIKTYIPPKEKPISEVNYSQGFETEAFRYDSEKNIYLCPAGKELHHTTFNKRSRMKRYQAKKKDCSNCPHREQCLGKSKNPRMVERHLHEEAKQEQMKFAKTPEYYEALRLRKIWCEGNFAQQKTWHNLRRTYKRGIERVTEQCLLSACALNLKRLVKAAKAVFFLCLAVRFFSFSAKKRGFVNSAVSLHPSIFTTNHIALFATDFMRSWAVHNRMHYRPAVPRFRLWSGIVPGQVNLLQRKYHSSGRNTPPPCRLHKSPGNGWFLHRGLRIRILWQTAFPDSSGNTYLWGQR